MSVVFNLFISQRIQAVEKSLMSHPLETFHLHACRRPPPMNTNNASSALHHFLFLDYKACANIAKLCLDL